jgi:hypothetical protein
MIATQELMFIIPFEPTTKSLLHLQESGFHLMMQQQQQAAPAPPGTLVMIFLGFRVCFSVVALDSGGYGDVFSVPKTQHLPLLLHTHTHTHTHSLSLSLSLSLWGVQLPWHYLFNCLLNCTHVDRQTASLALLASEIRVWDRVCPPPKKVDLERGGKQANKLKISLFTVQISGNRLTDTSCRSSPETFFYIEKLVMLFPPAPFMHNTQVTSPQSCIFC